VKEGPAADSLKAMKPDQPFDLAFIDADKISNTTYFKEAKRMLRSGGVIVRLSLTNSVHNNIHNDLLSRLSIMWEGTVWSPTRHTTANPSKVFGLYSNIFRATVKSKVPQS
jgi:hypothetical protein